MKIKVKKTKKSTHNLLMRLEEIFDVPVNSPEGNEAELLTVLIEKYEEENNSIEAPAPFEAIRFRMEQVNLKKKDLAEVIGYKSRFSEIFSRQRKFSLKVIIQLHKKLRILYESLLTEYQVYSFQYFGW